jgi:hypothetical protein
MSPAEPPTCSGEWDRHGRPAPHAPTPMEQDWMHDHVYRCPTCGSVTELWVFSDG